VFDDATDVEQRVIRQVGIAGTCENVFAVFEDGLMDVHAVAVVTYHWFWHEGRCFAKRICSVVYAVFQGLHFISFFDQAVECNTDFTLAGSRYFVMMDFYVQTHVLHRAAHSGTKVMQGIDRWDGEIAAFDAWTMTGVAFFVICI